MVRSPRVSGRARMRDVAKLAKVSTMTVSRVLSGAVPVAEETSNRVFRAIELLNYQPNQLARALRGSRSHMIGVLMPYLYDPFFAMCAHSINMVAQKYNYSVSFTTTNENSKTEFEEIRHMMRRQVDGIIVIPTVDGNSVLSTAEFHDLPIVTLDRPAPRTRFDSVTCDNKTGGQIATEHLLEHGHNSICYLGISDELYTFRMRFNGYETAMKKKGLKPEAFFDCRTMELVHDLLRNLIKRKKPPTALFTANGLTTRFALRGMAMLGVSVPHDMAIIGFDEPELSEVLRSPLTVVRQPVQELGRVAAELLFERLNNGKAQPPRRNIVLPVDLIVRESCGCGPHRAATQ